jgi:hypothetical protein
VGQKLNAVAMFCALLVVEVSTLKGSSPSNHAVDTPTACSDKIKVTRSDDLQGNNSWAEFGLVRPELGLRPRFQRLAASPLSHSRNAFTSARPSAFFDTMAK